MSDADRLAIAIPNLLAVLALGGAVLWSNRRLEKTGRRPAVWWQVVMLGVVAVLGLAIPSAAGKILVVILAVIAAVLGPTANPDTD